MSGTVFDADGEDKGWLGLSGCTMERNSYGSHAESFVQQLVVSGVGNVRAAFIRAPRVLDTQGWEVMGESSSGDPVILRSNTHMVCTFHPELTTSKVHECFVGVCAANR